MEPGPPAPRRLQPDLILAIAATLISLCALGTTYWQTKINKEWQQASVWPRLTFSVSTHTDDETATATYDLKLVNVGIGPALVRKMTVKYRGQELPMNSDRPRLSQFFYKVAEEHKVKSQRKLQTSQFEINAGLVIAAEKASILLAIKGETAYGTAIKEGLQHLEVAVEYCSVYGETWEVTYPRPGHRFVGWNEAQLH